MMEYVDPESLFEGSDGDDFRLFSNKEENLKFYNTINDLVISTSDKYPRNIESHMGFSKTHGFCWVSLGSFGFFPWAVFLRGLPPFFPFSVCAATRLS